ncbi:butyrophilin-like protein 2 isoform X2 [Melanotaenia boesemani]|uniref:butyrophilin-like protein 2 isoform X2 n=1 Tax=Melanotaenia boesemani TaxID=1250792 RepID=UPI001C04DA81|nr:butyrophilin-like protein 2 isoform X2 [Melanotaenia boesemani]
MKMLLVMVLLLHVSQHALPGVVEVNEGAESVLLPCELHGIPTKENLRVVWTCSDLSPRFVHQRGEEGDLEEQNQRYRGRTSMKPDALDSLDFSLTLRKPHLSDSSNYTCSITDGVNVRRVTDVELKVKDLQEEVKVTEGAESVILPCRTTPDLPKDVTVEWTRSDPDLMMVHVYPSTSKEFMKQSKFYRDRTEMYEDLLRSGDVSLTLKHPTDRDTGSYICTVYRDKDILRQKVVLIHVKVYQVKVESGAESVLLPCRTTVHLPGDAKVEWKDNKYRRVHVYENSSDQPEKQNQFYRTRTVMERNPLQSRNLSLTLKHPTDVESTTFTCRVYSKEGNILMEKQVRLTVRVYQVEVESEAESVLLPCRTTVHLPGDAKVEWRDNTYRKVHVYENSSDQPEEQHLLYRTRTVMERNPLQSRNLSLTLKHPTDYDSRTFTCSVYSREGNILMEKEVRLTVRDCQVEVEEGAESVLLPFRTTPDLPGDAEVEWRRLETKPEMKVHVYQNGSDQPEDQDQVYRSRTKMNQDPLKTGDFSLTLEHPKHGDSGRYICRLWRGGDLMRRKTVQLKVKGRVQVQDQRTSGTEADPTPLMADQSV